MFRANPITWINANFSPVAYDEQTSMQYESK